MPVILPPRKLFAAVLGLAVVAGLSGGCISAPSPRSARYDYFRPPAPGDPWTPKIAGWQARERRSLPRVELDGPAEVSGSGVDGQPPGRAHAASDLRAKYVKWRQERKRALARDLVQWLQAQAREHYIPDGPIDHWATLEGTLARGGDDCDGLELLAYHFLLDQGFRRDEVYRAIVFRPSDGQHHMVTLWFERRDDPWVLDPTGAMTDQMVRMSQRPDWTPLKVFSETEEYTVRPLPGGGYRYAALAGDGRRP